MNLSATADFSSLWVESFLYHYFKFVYSNKLLPFKMKSANPIQKYPYIIE